MIRLIRSILTGVGTFFTTQWKQYNPLGQLLFVLALAALAVDASISYQYGKSMTTLHGYGFAIVAIAFCILPDVATTEWRKGGKAAAAGIAFACVPLGLVAYQSHIGYGAGVRLGDMQQTGFQHATLERENKLLASELSNLEMWRKRLSELIGENKWAATVTADALRAQLPGLNLAIDQEAAAGGCKSKCLAKTKQRDEVASRIRILEERTDLQRKIEATQRVVDKKTASVSGMGYHSSTVVNQNDTFAKLFNLAGSFLGYSTLTPDQAIKPTEVQRDVANTAMAGSASLAFMLAAPILMLGAGLNRRKGLVVEDDDLSDRTMQSHAEKMDTRAVPRETNHVQTVNTPAMLRPQYDRTTIGAELRARLAT